MADKEYIDKHEAYLLLKQKAETYMLPATKEAYEKAAILIDSLPTIEVKPVNTDKCKALRNIEGIRLILSNVYNTGSTLQDCDYDAIYKRLDVIENILKGK